MIVTGGAQWFGTGWARTLLIAGVAVVLCVAPAATRDGTTVAVSAWVSTADGRLKCTEGGVPFAGAAAQATVRVDPQRRYQQVVGFGAALTDASASLLMRDLSRGKRRQILSTLFGDGNGLHLSMVRLTIGASDFSRGRYTLDDVPQGDTDVALRHFSMARERAYVIPAAREIRSINPVVRFIAAPWSAPAWMKTNGSLLGGTLNDKFDGVYAKYLSRYVEEMGKAGAPIYGLSVQNEPGFSPTTYPGMQLSAAQRARIIGKYLGPLLRHVHARTTVLEWDHNWDKPSEPLRVLADVDARQYIGAVAWHCYAGDASAQSIVHAKYPSKGSYVTECSVGGWDKHTQFMWFANDVLIAGLRNWSNGVVYWNLALDVQHGPHTGGCARCDALITIDTAGRAVTYDKMFYVMEQFSRFIESGSIRIGSHTTNECTKSVAFAAPNGNTVLVVTNTCSDAVQANIVEAGSDMVRRLPGKSISTFVWRSARAATDATSETRR